MQTADKKDFQDAMTGRYLADLAGQETLFRDMLEQTRDGTISPEQVADLRNRSHKLAGNGATFGFPDISKTAAALEDALMAGTPSQDEVAFCLDALIDACTATHVSAPAPVFKSKAETTASAEAPKAPPATSGRPKVLIVDDDPYARDALAGLLLSQAEISTAADAEQALAKMQNERPDLLLLDDQMPGALTGLQLQERIRQIDALKDLPIVMITASQNSDSVMRALSAGAVDYIVKPFDAEKVGERLRTRMQRLSKIVYIVDDDQAICDLLSRKLSAAGYKLRVFNDGLDALTAIMETPPALVVLDKMLPGLDGNMVLQKVREHEELRDLPVVVLSARRQERDIVSGFDLGATDYVVKPFNPQELIARCVRLLDA